MNQQPSFPRHTVEVAILCGGRGVRLKPLTDDMPKAMVPIQGRPMLEHIIDFFKKRAFDRLTLCVGYKAERIHDHFQDSAPNGDLRFSDVGENASMLQRLWALRESDRQRLLVIYGDTFINLDMDSLFNHHAATGAVATIVTAEIRNPFGIISFDENHWVSSFQEKPVHNHYIGCLLMETSAFSDIEPGMLAQPDGQGLVAFFQKLAAQRRLSAFPHAGLQITFNTEPERRRAERELGKYFTYPESL